MDILRRRAVRNRNWNDLLSRRGGHVAPCPLSEPPASQGASQKHRRAAHRMTNDASAEFRLEANSVFAHSAMADGEGAQTPTDKCCEVWRGKEVTLPAGSRLHFSQGRNRYTPNGIRHIYIPLNGDAWWGPSIAMLIYCKACNIKARHCWRRRKEPLKVVSDACTQWVLGSWVSEE